MTGEILAQFPTGATLYAVVLDANGQPWNGSAFDTTPTAGEWATYAVSMTEDSTIGHYRGTFPAVAAGVYSYHAHKRVGGSPATTDPVVWTGDGEWSGSAWLPLGTRLTATRASYLDNLAAGAVALEASVQTALTNIAAVPAAVWAAGSRSLTTFGSLVADIWAASTAPTAAAVAAAVWTVGNLTDAAADRLADSIIRRSFASVAASIYGDTASGRNLLRAGRKLANRVSMTTTPGFLDVFDESDAAPPAYSQAVDVDAAAVPTVEVG